MSHIDLTSAELDAVVARAARDPGMSPAPALLVSPEVLAVLKVETVDGHAYLGAWPVVVDLKTDPPPRVVDQQPLAEVQAERATALTAEVEAAIDAAYVGREQTLLMMDLAELDQLMRPGSGADFGRVDADVFSRLVAAVEWVKAARRLGAVAEDACAAATTQEALQAVTVDLASLGPSPRVRSRETRAALDAVQGA